MCVQDTVYPLLHGGQSEIQHQTYFEAHNSKVSEHLASVERSIPFTAFDFDNDEAIYQQVKAERLLDSMTAIAKRDDTLLLNVVASWSEFIGEQALIGRLEHARTKVAVQHDRCFHNR